MVIFVIKQIKDMCLSVLTVLQVKIAGTDCDRLVY